MQQYTSNKLKKQFKNSIQTQFSHNNKSYINIDNQKWPGDLIVLTVFFWNWTENLFMKARQKLQTLNSADCVTRFRSSHSTCFHHLVLSQHSINVGRVNLSKLTIDSFCCSVVRTPAQVTHLVILEGHGFKRGIHIFFFSHTCNVLNIMQVYFLISGIINAH